MDGVSLVSPYESGRLFGPSAKLRSERIQDHPLRGQKAIFIKRNLKCIDYESNAFFAFPNWK